MTNRTLSEINDLRNESTTIIQSTTIDQQAPFGSRQTEEILVAFVIALSAYLTLAAIFHQCNLGQRSLRWSNRLCTLCAGTLCFQSCWFVTEVYETLRLTDARCIAYLVIGIAMLVFNRSFIYLVLWIRQRGFYKDPVSARLSSCAVKFVSYATLTGIVALPVVQIVLHGLHQVYATPVGCISATDLGFIKALNPIAYVLFAFCQIALLGLVLLPIVKHCSLRQSSSHRVKGVVVRLSVCTAVCVATDIGFLVFSAFRSSKWSSISFVPIIYSYNAVVNIAALNFSFADYNLRLFPFYRNLHSNAINNELVISNSGNIQTVTTTVST